MPEKRKNYLKILVIALIAGLLTLLISLGSAYWGAKYEEIPEDAAAWHEPENDEVQQKVREIASRIYAGKTYGFEELLYIYDHDSKTAQEVQDFLIAQGKEALSAAEE